MELKNDNKFLKHEFKKLKEKVELKLQQGENPEVAATISGIVDEEFPNLPLLNFLDLNDLEQSVSKEPSKATSLVNLLLTYCYKLRL